MGCNKKSFHCIVRLFLFSSTHFKIKDPGKKTGEKNKEESLFYPLEHNCILRTRYEANFLGEKFPDGFDLYHCIARLDGRSVFGKTPQVEVTETAADLGYTDVLPLEGYQRFLSLTLFQ